MSKISIDYVYSGIVDVITSLTSAVMFYTILPLPTEWSNNWSRIARWCPLIGLFIGLILAVIEVLLNFAGFPPLTRSTLVVITWVAITGGLHLDGAMDTADGLSVTDPQRRLEVMKDSHTGAFGAIAAIIILLLKTVALSEISLPIWFVLPIAAGWARWGQVWAIARYDYLRATGKGAFHRQNLRSPHDVLLGLIVLLSFVGFWFTVSKLLWWQIGVIVTVNMVIPLLTGYWLNQKLEGHTGDTYGAVVEWSEALILGFLTVF
ncbi:MAG: adenosylcobinamide-GDP ribazoletransferase [Cyanobacteria bacterium P01_G01_bin.39]